MTTIIAGSPAEFDVTVQSNGKPVPVSGAVAASIFTMDGKHQLAGPITLDESDGWGDGVVAVRLDSSDTEPLEPGEAMLVLQGAFGIKRFRLDVETLFEPTRTSLFIKDIVVDEIRNDRLMAASNGVLSDIHDSDEYIWSKVRSAESELSHTLRVPLVPTRFFPHDPNESELADLDGMAWAVESAQDYLKDMFSGDKWGYVVTRQRPIISIERLRLVYPTEANGYYDIPLSWMNIDAKYGHVRMVPTSNAILTGLMGVTIMGMAVGRTIPSMVRLTYTAGLQDVERTYPELLDAIKKLAVVKIVGDAFLPQSGSISADGLSESISTDMGKYHDEVDRIVNGPKGSNGGLMTKIHGIRAQVV